MVTAVPVPPMQANTGIDTVYFGAVPVYGTYRTGTVRTGIEYSFKYRAEQCKELITIVVGIEVENGSSYLL
jgi:hypothetical protein